MFGHAMEDFHCLESAGSRGTRGADLEDKHDCDVSFKSQIYWRVCNFVFFGTILYMVMDGGK